MEASQAEDTLYYVIEHFEWELSRWTLSEYVNMILTLANLYNTKTTATPNALIITNFPYTAKLNREELKEDELGTLANTQRLDNIRQNFKNKCLISELSFKELTTKDTPADKLTNRDDTLAVRNILLNGIGA